MGRRDGIVTSSAGKEIEAMTQGSSISGNGSAGPDDVGMMEEQKRRAASGLRDMAHLMRERATNAPLPGVDRAAEAAAKPLETGAAYIEEHSPRDMWSDLMEFCRKHPAGALFLGFGLGYFFHKLFR
jgi:hypothetical protein